MKKLYWLCWVIFACLVYLTPTTTSQARFPLGFNIYGSDTCGTSTNNWCIGYDGWTVFTPTAGTGTCLNSGSNYTGTCIVYVDPVSGNDSTCTAVVPPVSSMPALPCLTMAMAYLKLRNNKPDWMLLKSAGTFTGGIAGGSNGFNISGLSVAQPMLISTYGGSARAIVQSGNGTGVGDAPGFLATASTHGQFLAITNLKIYCNICDPNNGAFVSNTVTGNLTSGSGTINNLSSVTGLTAGQWIYGSGISGTAGRQVTAINPVTCTAPCLTFGGTASANLTTTPLTITQGNNNTAIALGNNNFAYIENCEISFFSEGISVGTGTNSPPNVTLYVRRNYIHDNYSISGGHGQGIFVDDHAGPFIANNPGVFYQNVLDHNGYNETVFALGATIFSHNVYMHNSNPPFLISENISTRASANQWQLRNGGTAYNNLGIQNPDGMISNPGGLSNPTLYSYNVMLEGSDNNNGALVSTTAPTVGTNVLTVASIPQNYVFSGGPFVKDLTNPAAIPASTSISSQGTYTFTLSHNTQSPGVQIGDVLQFYSSQAIGSQLSTNGPIFPIAPSVNTAPCAGTPAGAPCYAIGSTVIDFSSTFPSSLTPTWVTVGMTAIVFQQSNVYFPNGTTVSSISTDLTQVTLSAANTSAFNGNEQASALFYTPGDYSHFSSTVAFNNVFADAVGVSPQAALSLGVFSANIQAGGNYFYNWAATTAGNTGDQGIAGTNTLTPATDSTGSSANYAGSSKWPNASIEAYDLSIGGPGTLADFLAGAAANQHSSWDPRYTAPAANNFIRPNIGCTPASVPACLPQ